VKNETLKQLNVDIENAEAVDDTQAQAMIDLQNQIQRSLEDSEYYPTLIDILNRSISMFQAEHPQLARSIRSAVEILSEGGL
jgi:Domain of unknown function (DUF4404)